MYSGGVIVMATSSDMGAGVNFWISNDNSVIEIHFSIKPVSLQMEHVVSNPKQSQHLFLTKTSIITSTIHY